MNPHPHISQDVGKSARRPSCLLRRLACLGALAAASAQAAVVDGQLWYTGFQFLGSNSTNDNQVGRINSDKSSQTAVLISADASYHYISVGVDTAAGLYFALSTNAVPPSGTALAENLVVGNLNTGAIIQTLQLNPTDYGIEGLAVNPVNHTVYVGVWGDFTTDTGIVKISYNPATGAVPASVFTTVGGNQVINPIYYLTTESGGSHETFASSLWLDVPNQKLYFTDEDINLSTGTTWGSPYYDTNGIFVIDLNAATPTATLLSSTAQFPATNAGYHSAVESIAVDTSKSLIYFETTNLATGSPANMQIWYLPLAGGTATAMSIPAAVNLDNGYYGTFAFDPATRTLYLSTNGDSTKTPVVPGYIYALPLSADGHSFASGATFAQINSANPNLITTSLFFESIPKLAITGISAHVVEQASAAPLLTAASISDADGVNLVGGSVVISGSFVGSGDELSVLDGATSRTSGTVSGTTISVAVTTNAGGNQTLTLSGTDTIAHYQSVLGKLQFRANSDTPTNGGANPTRTLTWTVSDGTPSIPAGAQNSGITTITIDAVDDAPVVTAGTTVAYTEQATAVVIASSLTVSDPDNTTLTGASVSIGSFVVGDTLSFTNTASVTGSYNASTGVLTLSGTDTLANYQVALRSIKFSSSSDDPTAGGSKPTRTISFVVNDGTLSSAAATSTINITAVDDVPVVTAGTTVAYTEQAAAVVIASSLTVSDADNATLASASVLISNFVAGDTLSFTNTGSISGSYNVSTGVLTLSGTDTLANYQLALRLVKFSSSSDDPTAGGTKITRTISFVVSDGTLNSTAAASTINITAVDDAPVVTAGTTVAYTEQATAVVIASSLTVSDPDNTTLAGASVSIGSFVVGDTLSFTNTASITGSYNASTGVLALSGTDTLANYQAALRSIKFSSSSDDPTAGGTKPTRTVSFVVNDGALSSAAATSTINITAVDDVPVVTAGTTVGYTEQAVAVVIASPLTVSDADNATLASASVLISNFVVGDTLSFTNTASITGSYNASTGVLTLSGTDTLANYQLALRLVKFSSSSDDPTAGGTKITRTISFVVSDGTLNSTAATSTINVTAVNDAPVNTVPGAQSTISDTDLVLTGFSVIDVDAGAGNETSTLAVLHGTVTIASAGASVITGNGSSSVTVSGTLAQINATLSTANNVIYHSVAGYSGGDTLTFTTNDNGNTGGGAQIAMDSVSITVIALSPPSMTEAFAASVVHPNVATAVTFTITNPAANTVALTGVAFTDNLPGSLIVATPNGMSNSCGGSVSAIAGSSTISLSGGGVAPAGSCTLSVNVLATSAGQFPNMSGPVTSTNGGTGNTASATLTVIQASLSVSIGDAHAYARYGQLMNYSVTISNAGPSDANDIAIAETLSAQFDVTNASWVCTNGGSGAVCTASGTGALADSNVVIPASRSLTWMVSATVLPGATGVSADNSIQVTTQADANAPYNAIDSDVLVLFRDGFDASPGDGTGSSLWPNLESAPTATSASMPLLTTGSNLTLAIPESAGLAPIDVLLRGLAADGSGFRIERMNLGNAPRLRVVSIGAQGAERAGAWLQTGASKPFAIGLAGERNAVLVLETADAESMVALGSQGLGLYRLWTTVAAGQP